MIISHKYRFIFICNGRTGTTSIESALKGYDDDSRDMNNGARGLWANKHMPPAVIKGLVSARVWEEYFKFVFVRHPQDWFVSQYKHNFHSPARSIRTILKRPQQALHILANYRTSRELASRRLYDSADVDILFAHLTRYRGLPGSPGLFQSNYVYDADGNQLVDMVGRFEQINEDIERIQDAIGLRFELPHLNKTCHEPYERSFTRRGVQHLQELWKVDFDNFGYAPIVPS
jgi:hypothetical protein